MTKREMFTAIREVVAANPEMVAFIDREIELLNRKRTSKPTKTQIENEGLRADILEHLTAVDSPKAIKELQAEIPTLAPLSNQRIAHLLKRLVDDGKVAKEYIKKTPYFSIAA